MADCIFCKFVSREIETKRVYEDENTLAFLDINPANKGHTLVISKAHIPTIYDATEEQLKGLIVAVKRVAMAVKQATQCKGINIIQNNEPVAGQVIDHIHVHIIPRNMEDGNDIKMQRLDIKEEDQKKVAKLIREAIQLPVKPKSEDKVHVMLDKIDANLKELDDILK